MTQIPGSTKIRDHEFSRTNQEGYVFPATFSYIGLGTKKTEMNLTRILLVKQVQFREEKEIKGVPKERMIIMGCVI